MNESIFIALIIIVGLIALKNMEMSRSIKMRLSNLERDVAEITRWMGQKNDGDFHIAEQFSKNVESLCRKNLDPIKSIDFEIEMKRLGEEFLKSFSIRFEGDPLWQRVRWYDDESAETKNERLSYLLDQFMKVQEEAGVPEDEQINLMSYVDMRK